MEKENIQENNLNLNVKEDKKEDKESFWDLLKFAIIAIIIVVPIRIFIAQPFVVSGQSMFPTFSNGDYLIVDELSYHLGDPERNEVIIFRYPKDPKKFYIKRVIGLPNETINIQDGIISIFNKENEEILILKEPHIKYQTIGDITYNLKEKEYFVLGDNRIQSSDSRYWGALPRDMIVGKAFLRLFPLNKINIFPGKAELLLESSQ